LFADPQSEGLVRWRKRPRLSPPLELTVHDGMRDSWRVVDQEGTQ
jgi:hypothetical protein